MVSMSLHSEKFSNETSNDIWGTGGVMFNVLVPIELWLAIFWWKGYLLHYWSFLSCHIPFVRVVFISFGIFQIWSGKSQRYWKNRYNFFSWNVFVTMSLRYNWCDFKTSFFCPFLSVCMLWILLHKITIIVTTGKKTQDICKLYRSHKLNVSLTPRVTKYHKCPVLHI